MLFSKAPIALFSKLILVSCFIFLMACSENSTSELPSLENHYLNPVKKVPDFSAIKNVREKKARFFSFIEPLVKQENKRIATIRRAALNLKKKPIAALTVEEKKWLNALAAQYNISADVGSDEFWKLIDKRVDQVPVSLVMAQAAMESAWGTSRFAQQANNLFGQWCYTKGCGLVPSRRNEGAVHEVRKFKTVNDAVASYMRNLNTNKVYRSLRERRHSIQKNGQKVSGLELAFGLHKYSERGMDYVREIQSMINTNKLYVYDI